MRRLLIVTGTVIGMIVLASQGTSLVLRLVGMAMDYGALQSVLQDEAEKDRIWTNEQLRLMEEEERRRIEEIERRLRQLDQDNWPGIYRHEKEIEDERSRRQGPSFAHHHLA